jgi:hypothetical protein
MKNFSEATAIKSKLYFPVELMLSPIEQCVCVALINNTVVHDGLLTGPKSILVNNITVDGPIDIKIIITRQHPESVEVGIRIDGRDIIPIYQHLAKPQTNYLNFNGEWQLSIPNFYTWYHTVTGQGWIA